MVAMSCKNHTKINELWYDFTIVAHIRNDYRVNFLYLTKIKVVDIIIKADLSEKSGETWWWKRIIVYYSDSK